MATLLSMSQREPMWLHDGHSSLSVSCCCLFLLGNDYKKTRLSAHLLYLYLQAASWDSSDLHWLPTPAKAPWEDCRKLCLPRVFQMTSTWPLRRRRRRIFHGRMDPSKHCFHAKIYRVWSTSRFWRRYPTNWKKITWSTQKSVILLRHMFRDQSEAFGHALLGSNCAFSLFDCSALCWSRSWCSISSITVQE